MDLVAWRGNWQHGERCPPRGESLERPRPAQTDRLDPPGGTGVCVADIDTHSRATHSVVEMLFSAAINARDEFKPPVGGPSEARRAGRFALSRDTRAQSLRARSS